MQIDNNVRKRKRYTKRSWVWQYMVASDDGMAECRLCKDLLKYESSTSSLIWHLEEKHKIKPDGFCNNKKIRLAILSESEDEVDGGSMEEDRNIVLSSYSKKKQVTMNNKLIDFIVENNMPISIVKSEKFKALLKEALPSYVLPCRQTITQNLIPEKVINIKILNLIHLVYNIFF